MQVKQKESHRRKLKTEITKKAINIIDTKQLDIKQKEATQKEIKRQE